jgi:CMP-N-acetylneuraminic acid synthetase
MEIVAFIFARSGSKGLPGKNIKLLNGKPLIAYSIEHARAVKRIKRIIVSTDSEYIAKIALQFGAEVPFIRPATLATDESPEWLAWRHALEFVRKEKGSYPDAMVSVPPTSPLRIPQDIENCIDDFENYKSDVVITVTNSHRNPYFNMVSNNLDGSVSVVNHINSTLGTRQSAPQVKDVTTVCYVAKPEFVMSYNSIFEGHVRSVHVPIERAIDIDTFFDFEIAEFLFNKKVKNHDQY